MSTVTTQYGDAGVTTSGRRGLLRRTVAGAAAFDAAMGVVCLVTPSTFGRLYSGRALGPVEEWL